MAITLINQTASIVGLTDTCNAFSIPSTGAGNLLVAVAISPDFGPTHWLPAGLGGGCGNNFLESDVDGVFKEVPYFSLPDPPQADGSTAPWMFASYDDTGERELNSSVDILYQVSSGGTTNIKFNISDISAIWVFEFASDQPGVWSLDDFHLTGAVTISPVVGATLSGTGAFDVYINAVRCVDATNAMSGVSLPWTLGILQTGHQTPFVAPAYLIGTGAQSAPSFTMDNNDKFTAAGASFIFTPTTPPPPPPPIPATTCAPVDGSGIPINGVFVSNLSLFIIPATSLYKNLVPNSAIRVNESPVQGREAIILDFNNNEGIYSRDMGTIFTWDLQTDTTLDIWQPSIIPMDGEVYDRLSYHCLMTSLGTIGWQHAREMNIAYAAPSGLTLLLSFDQWPNIQLTMPASVVEIKQKLILPPNKFKLVEVFLSSPQPFKLWANDLEMKIKQWGSAEAYRVARPVSG
jgi:hypothetical protein